MIKPEDIIDIDLPDDAGLRALVNGSAAYYMDSWQANREPSEKVSDIITGKVGERGTEQVFPTLSVAHISYDDVRKDNFMESALLDGFVAGTELSDYIRSERFAAGLWEKYESRRIPDALKRCAECGIFAYEVKSTRISNRHLANGKVDRSRLLEDNFMIYPGVRAGVLTDKVRADLLQPESRQRIARHKPPYLFQAFVEDLGTGRGWRVYVTGYMLTSSFLVDADLDVRRLYKAGKSEQAIYYTLPIWKGNPLSTLATISATIN